MKSTTFAVAAVSLLQLAAAQPHRVRHEQLHKKDNVVVVTKVNTVYAEATNSPQVIVYVDQDGKPVSTTTDWSEVEPATSAPAEPTYSAEPAPVAPSVAAVAPSVAAVETPVAPVATYAPAPVESSSSKAESTPAPTTSSSTPASTPSTGGSTGFGLVYSPYNADGTCKTQSQVNTDFESISKDYTLIRTYGVDCDQVATVLSVVKARGIKMFAGIFDISALDSAVATIVSAAGGDWSNFETISVGNELVNSGRASAATVVAAIGTARTLLKAAGYTGNVVTVDTLVAARNNPSLCDASDFCAVNCHPFFDGGVAAADSGKFLTEQIPTLQEKLANKNQKVVITETGWPWQGQTNGKAVPSMSNQEAAISSIKASYASSPESIILFTAFNDMWKKNDASQFMAEQFWGMGGNNPPSG